MADVDEKDLKTIAAFEFGLPDDEFRDLVFARRLDSEGSKSPSALSNNLQTESSGRNHRQSTIDDTEGIPDHLQDQFLRQWLTGPQMHARRLHQWQVKHLFGVRAANLPGSRSCTLSQCQLPETVEARLPRRTMSKKPKTQKMPKDRQPLRALRNPKVAGDKVLADDNTTQTFHTFELSLRSFP